MQQLQDYNQELQQQNQRLYNKVQQLQQQLQNQQTELTELRKLKWECDIMTVALEKDAIDNEDQGQENIIKRPSTPQPEKNPNQQIKKKISF